MDLYIQNVTTTTETGYKMDLDKIKEKFLNNAVYEKEKFPGLILKLMNPKSSFLIFYNGKVICVGTKSVNNSIIAIKTIFEKLRNMGFNTTKNPNIEVENIVCTANIGFKLNPKDVMKFLPRSMYESLQFPGIIHRSIDPVAVLLIFSSGRIVCTGTKNEKDAASALGQLVLSLKSAGFNIQ